MKGSDIVPGRRYVLGDRYHYRGEIVTAEEFGPPGRVWVRTRFGRALKMFRDLVAEVTDPPFTGTVQVGGRYYLTRHDHPVRVTQATNGGLWFHYVEEDPQRVRNGFPLLTYHSPANTDMILREAVPPGTGIEWPTGLLAGLTPPQTRDDVIATLTARLSADLEALSREDLLDILKEKLAADLTATDDAGLKELIEATEPK